MPTTTSTTRPPSACPRPAPYTGKVRTYAQVLDEFISTLPGLNRHQRQALHRLRLEVGAKIEDYDASPHQLAELWDCSLPTARSYIRAFIGQALAREITPFNRGARKATIYAFDFTAFPQFGDVLKKAAQQVPEGAPKKEISPSPEGKPSSLRSEGIPSRKDSYSSRKAPEAGAAATGAQGLSGKKKNQELVIAEAVLEQGAKVFQEVIGLDRAWARKAMAHAAKAFGHWDELVSYAKAVQLVMRKIQAKGTLDPEKLPRAAYNRLVWAVQPRRRNKILRESRGVAAFLARAEARKQSEAEAVAKSRLAGTQTVDADGVGLRVKIPAGVVPSLVLPYLTWLRASAAVPDSAHPGFDERFDIASRAKRQLVQAAEGLTPAPRLAEMEAQLRTRLASAGLEADTLVWRRAWQHHWDMGIFAEFGME